MARAATRPRKRVPLSRERVLAAAVELADTEGIGALTMRNLAQHLGSEPMSLYYHVANKSTLLDGAVEIVVGEILENVARAATEHPEGDWQDRLRRRILAAREVMLHHPWAPALLSRPESFGPTIAFYFEGVLAILIEGGFSYDQAHHALHALGSRGIGFSQELFQPDDAAEDMSAETLEQMAEALPHLTGMMQVMAQHDPDSTLGWCDDQAEFEFGIDVLLAGLESARLADTAREPTGVPT